MAARRGLQTANVVGNDSNFSGPEEVPSRFSVNEGCSLEDFRGRTLVILTLDTKSTSGKPYERRPYPLTWPGMEPKSECSTPLMRRLTHDLAHVAPGYSLIQPRPSGKTAFDLSTANPTTTR